MKRFLLKTAFFALSVVAGFELLFRAGFDPVITNSTFFDHKMLSLQRHPLREVKLLAAGSSIAVYSLNSTIITQNIQLPYYNFGSWNLQMGDTRILLDYLVKRYNPEYVLICSTLVDFTDATNDTYLHYTKASRWEQDRLPELFYFTDFHSIHQIAYRKSRSRSLHLDIDEWGGGVGLFDPAGILNNGDRQGMVNQHVYVAFRYPFLEVQYQELDSLCAALQAARIKLIFAQSPVEASFLGTDSLRRMAALHFEKCQSIVEGHKGAYFNYYDTAVFRDSLFADAIHLNTEGAKVLTRRLVADLKTVIGR